MRKRDTLTQDYLRAQLAKHNARLDALVDKSLTAIDEGLTALRDDAADHGAAETSDAEA
jgi:hypothetical protein